MVNNQLNVANLKLRLHPVTLNGRDGAYSSKPCKLVRINQILGGAGLGEALGEERRREMSAFVNFPFYGSLFLLKNNLFKL